MKDNQPVKASGKTFLAQPNVGSWSLFDYVNVTLKISRNLIFWIYSLFKHLICSAFTKNEQLINQCLLIWSPKPKWYWFSKRGLKNCSFSIAGSSRSLVVWLRQHDIFTVPFIYRKLLLSKTNIIHGYTIKVGLVWHYVGRLSQLISWNACIITKHCVFVTSKFPFSFLLLFVFWQYVITEKPFFNFLQCLVKGINY